MEFLLVPDSEQSLFTDNAVVQVRLGIGGIAATHLGAASRGGSRGRRCVAWHSAAVAACKLGIAVLHSLAPFQG